MSHYQRYVKSLQSERWLFKFEKKKLIFSKEGKDGLSILNERELKTAQENIWIYFVYRIVNRSSESEMHVKQRISAQMNS